MTVCAMFGCKNRMHKGCGKHFFRFPMKDPERLARWIEAVQRDDWKPSVHSKVCSDHFTEKDYMIRPGAACPYLRTDAVPTPLFIQRKKKTKKRKYMKKSVTPAPSEGKAQAEEAQSPMEDMAAQEAGTPSGEPPEAPGETPAVESQGEETGDGKQADETDNVQESEPGAQEQGGAGTEAETQSQEPIETGGPAAGDEQAPGYRIDADSTTQNERQVALILAELEDTHCEMRAAEARAAREAAGNNEPPPGDGASSDNQSTGDNPADYIPFDHAYTSLTMSDKENNVPPPSSAPSPAPIPSPASNLKAVKLRKKIKTLQKQVLRQGVKIKSLKQTLVELRRNNLSEKNPERVIAEHCGGLALALFTTQLKNHRKYSAMQYCNLLKDFALNLYQASPKAYKLCRLFLSLPHPVSLRHWKTASEANQGASQEEVARPEAPQGEMSQEDILAGALQAVVLEAEAAQEGALQDEALPGVQTQ